MEVTTTSLHGLHGPQAFVQSGMLDPLAISTTKQSIINQIHQMHIIYSFDSLKIESCNCEMILTVKEVYSEAITTSHELKKKKNHEQRY